MDISRTATGLLAAVCVAAGAGGAFLALRNDAAPLRAPEQIEAAPEATPSSGVKGSQPLVAQEPAVNASPEKAKAAPAASKPRQKQQVAAAQRNETPAPRVEQSVSPREPVAIQAAAPISATEPPAVANDQAPQPVDPGPVYEELVIAADSVIGLQLESAATSERAQVEDSIVARVTRDVRVADRVAIPSGARAFGEVTLVEQGGKLRDRARLGIRFTSIALADGTRLPIHSEVIYREGEAPGRASATKIGGGAIGGAIIGGILGGAKGAAIGTSIGAGAGTAAVGASDRNHATLSAGSILTVRLEEPVVVTVER